MDSFVKLCCLIDDFCQEFEPLWKRYLLTHGQKKRRRRSALSLSELMPLIVLFHQLGHRQFRRFYLDYACRHWRAESGMGTRDTSANDYARSGVWVALI